MGAIVPIVVIKIIIVLHMVKKIKKRFFLALLGGAWDNGANAGGFDWDLDNAASYRYRIVGGRLEHAIKI